VKRTAHWLLLPLFLSWLGIAPARAQDSTQLTFRPDLLELLNAKVAVNKEQTISTGTLKATSLREAAGIMTVINAEVIKNSGARDITELLRLVPGLDFGMDPDGTTGISVRGNYGMEGKVLVLIDGIQMNEVAYGGFFFYPRIPLANIERIEVIRGPGSAIYGGFAAAAVINIISKTYLQGVGHAVATQVGMASGGLSRTNLQFTTAQKYANETEVYFSGYVGSANRSNLTYTHPYDQTINYRDSSWVRAANLNLGLKRKRFNLRLVYDQVRAKTIHNLGEHVNNGVYGLVNYTFRLGKHLTFAPRLQAKLQTPWNFQDGNLAYQLGSNMQIGRASLDGVLLYQPSARFSWATGVEYFMDKARLGSRVHYFYNGRNDLSFSNFGAFTELVWGSKYGNLVLGGRIDRYGVAKPAFVPRIAYTKAFKNFHVKYLYSYAFKNPTLMNISVSEGNIRPEYAETTELEVGYQWKSRLQIAASLFHTNFSDMISYEYDPARQVDIYTNAGSTGTNGAEIELRYTHKRGYFNANFSRYVPSMSSTSFLDFDFLSLFDEASNVQVQKLTIEEQDRQFVGLPPHRFTAQAHYKLGNRWGANLSMLWFSQKTAYVANPDYSEASIVDYPATTIVNLNFTCDNFLLKGLDLGIGLYNALDQRQFLTIYQRLGAPPFLEQGREMVIRLKYQL
jgi:outer membrane receptor protein involved in Fe transport